MSSSGDLWVQRMWKVNPPPLPNTRSLCLCSVCVTPVCPARLEQGENLEENQGNLRQITGRFFQAIIGSSSEFPPQLRSVCHCLYQVRPRPLPLTSALVTSSASVCVPRHSHQLQPLHSDELWPSAAPDLTPKRWPLHFYAPLDFTLHCQITLTALKLKCFLQHFIVYIYV